MASLQEKAQCVLCYHEINFPVTIRRKFRNEYGRELPDVKTIKVWTGRVGDLERTGRPSVNEETADVVERNLISS